MAALKRESTLQSGRGGNRRGPREGSQGGGGRGRRREEKLRVIQGRRYGLPAVVARQQEKCCVRWLSQISSGGKGDRKRRVSVYEGVQRESCRVRLLATISPSSHMGVGR